MPIFDRILAFLRTRFSIALDLVEIIQETAILRIFLLLAVASCAVYQSGADAADNDNVCST